MKDNKSDIKEELLLRKQIEKLIPTVPPRGTFSKAKAEDVPIAMKFIDKEMETGYDAWYIIEYEKSTQSFYSIISSTDPVDGTRVGLVSMESLIKHSRIDPEWDNKTVASKYVGETKEGATWHQYTESAYGSMPGGWL
jgi:hypothetical protein